MTLEGAPVIRRAPIGINRRAAAAVTGVVIAGFGAIGRINANNADNVGPFANCSDARAAGVAPLLRGSSGYAQHLDGDHDGVACEPYVPHTLYTRRSTGHTRGLSGRRNPVGIADPSLGAGPFDVREPLYENGPRHDSASFDTCTEARAAGAAPILFGDPAYAPRLDRDGDGVACE